MARIVTQGSFERQFSVTQGSQIPTQRPHERTLSVTQGSNCDAEFFCPFSGMQGSRSDAVLVWGARHERAVTGSASRGIQLTHRL